MPTHPQTRGPLPGGADDRDDSSKTTPASDMQGDDAGSPASGATPAAEGNPADRNERREQGPRETRSSKSMKQESRTGEGR